MEIRIIDVNDNRPAFNVSILTKVIPENIPVGSKIDLSTVYDPDEGDNSIVSINIVSGDPNNQFKIDFHESDTKGQFYCRLVLQKSLDYEQRSSYSLNIEAVDGGKPQSLSGYLSVKIVVENANDNLPQFDLSRYSVSVKESWSKNKKIMTVQASDADKGNAGKITYRVIPNNVFDVDKNSGQLTLKGSLDFERQKQYKLTLIANDNASPFHSSTVPLTVSVIDENDNPPNITVKWLVNSKKLYLNIKPNTKLCHIIVTDEDTVSKLFTVNVYSKFPLKLDKILRQTWELSVDQNVKSRKLSSGIYTFTVKVIDLASPSLTVIKNFELNFEAQKPKTTIFSSVSFDFSYNVTLLQSLFRDTKNALIFTFPSNLTKSFKLTNYNQFFYIQENYLFSKVELNCGLYDVIVTSQLLYIRLRINVKGDSREPIYFSNGFIRRFVRREKIKTTDITTSTKSTTTAASTKNLSSSSSLLKNKCFFQITVANNHCISLKVRYSLQVVFRTASKATRETNLFRMTENGWLCKTAELDSMSTLQSGQYMYRIVAETQGSSAVAILHITVLPNEKLLQPFTNRLIVSPIYGAGQQTVAVAIAGFKNSDLCNYRGLIRYRHIGGGSSDEGISVDQYSGQIQLNSQLAFPRDVTVSVEWATTELDKMKFDRQNMMIRITKSGRFHFSETVYRFYIKKLQGDRRDVSRITVGVVNTNSIAQVKYEIVNASLLFEYQTVEIDSQSGQITILNLEKLPNSLISFSVSATNRASKEKAFCQVIVHIYAMKITSNSRRIVQKLDLTIWENADIGTEVYQVIDKPCSSIERPYRIIYTQHKNELFKLSAATGQLFVNKLIDRELINRTSIKIKSQFSQTVWHLLITVLDVNDNRPICHQKSLNMTINDDAYNIGKTSFCSLLNCYDLDTGINANLTYQLYLISPIDNVKNPFNINLTTGCINIVTPLDLADGIKSKLYKLLIEVSDNGVRTTHITEVKLQITVKRGKYHRPRLISYPIYIQIYPLKSQAPIGRFIIEGMSVPVSKLQIFEAKYRQYFQLVPVISSNRSQRQILILFTQNRNMNEISPGVHIITLIYGTGYKSGIMGRRVRHYLEIRILPAELDAALIEYPQHYSNIEIPCPRPMGFQLLKPKILYRNENDKIKYRFYLYESSRLFSVDEFTGILYAKSVLHCSGNKHKLTIIMSRLGYKLTNQTITIYIVTGEMSNWERRVDNLVFIIDRFKYSGAKIGKIDHSFPGSNNSLRYLFLPHNTTISPDGLFYIEYYSNNLYQMPLQLSKQRQQNQQYRQHLSQHTTNYRVLVTFQSLPILPRHQEFQLTIISKLYPQHPDFQWPQFIDPPKRLSVKENSKSGTVVHKFQVQALLAPFVDFGLHQSVTIFVVNRTSGELLVFVPPDFEQHTKVIIEMSVTDYRYVNRRSVVEVEVEIEDVNDNYPLIVSPKTSIVDVKGPFSVGQELIKVIARDGDQNTVVNYSIYCDDICRQTVQIDQSKGILNLKQVPMIKQLRVKVQVTDNGDPPLTTSVVLTLNFLRELGRKNMLRFQRNNYEFTLDLSVIKYNYSFGKLGLTNTYEVSLLKPQFRLFSGVYASLIQLNSTTGELYLSPRMRQEDIPANNKFQVAAVVQSSYDPLDFSLATVSVKVTFGNKHRPQFLKQFYEIKIPEGTPFTEFLTVPARDVDSGIYGSVKYRLTGDLDGRIYINPLTGSLSCSELSYTDVPSYKLFVIASDSYDGEQSKSATATVSVYVMQSDMTQLSYSSSYRLIDINSTQPINSVLYQLTVQQTNIQNVRYYLEVGHPVISLDPVSGNLTLIGSLYRQYLLKQISMVMVAFAISPVRKTLLSARISITIRINHIQLMDNTKSLRHHDYATNIIRDNLIVVTLTSLNKRDDSTELCQLKTIQNDPDDQRISNIRFNFSTSHSVTRKLVGRDPYFRIDYQSGLLYQTRSLSAKLFHNRPIFLHVFVWDKRRPKEMSLLIVTIMPPIPIVVRYLQLSSQSRKMSVGENKNIGDLIGQLKLVDNFKKPACPNPTVTVVNKKQINFVQIKRINRALFLVLTSRVDREIIDKFTVVVELECSLELIGYDKISVSVRDVDDNIPQFTQTHYQAVVKEGQPVNTFVIPTYIYDPDVGQNREVEYFLEQNSEEEFIINSAGVVHTRIPLNYHTKSRYDLVVKAISKSNPSIFAQSKLTIHVANINDQRPIFAKPSRTITLFEDDKSVIGKVLSRIEATDSDGPLGISYSIRRRLNNNKGNNSNRNNQYSARSQTSFLSIALDSGELTVIRPLTQLDVGYSEYLVRATDGRFSATALLKIIVKDVNNNAPKLIGGTKKIVLDQFIRDLKLETMPNTPIASLSGYDSDIRTDNDHILFKINQTPSKKEKDYFRIQNIGGNKATVSLTTTYSAIPDGVYFLSIELSEKPSKKSSIVSRIETTRILRSITVLAVVKETSNPNSPKFLNRIMPAQLIVDGNSVQYGQLISQLSCSDDDAQQTITYQIETLENCADMFTIDTNNGDIYYVGRSIKSATVNSKCRITVRCIDNGFPERYSEQTFSVLFSNKLSESQKQANYILRQYVRLTITQRMMVNLPYLLHSLHHQTGNKKIISIEPANENSNQRQLVQSATLKPTIPIFKLDPLNNLMLYALKSSLVHFSFKWIVKIRVFDPRFQLFSYIIVNILISLPKPVRTTCPIRLPSITTVASENIPIGSKILTLSRYNNNMGFSIDDNYEFKMDCNKQICVLFSLVSLDYERQKSYMLQTRIHDSTCSYRVNLMVQILDEDEYAPVWTGSNRLGNDLIVQHRRPDEDGIPKLGEPLYKFNAQDKDGGIYGMVYYWLVRGEYLDYFNLNNVTGELTLQRSLGKETENGKRVKRDAYENTRNDKKKKVKNRHKFTFIVGAGSGQLFSTVKVILDIPVPVDFLTRGNESTVYWLTPLHLALVCIVPLITVLILVAILIYFLLKRSRSSPETSKISNAASTYKECESWRSLHTDSPKTDTNYSTHIISGNGQLCPTVPLVNASGSSTQLTGKEHYFPPPPMVPPTGSQTQYFPSHYHQHYQQQQQFTPHDRAITKSHNQIHLDRRLPDVALLTQTGTLPHSETQTFNLDTSEDENIHRPFLPHGNNGENNQVLPVHNNNVSFPISTGIGITSDFTMYSPQYDTCQHTSSENNEELRIYNTGRVLPCRPHQQGSNPSLASSSAYSAISQHPCSQPPYPSMHQIPATTSTAITSATSAAKRGGQQYAPAQQHQHQQVVISRLRDGPIDHTRINKLSLSSVNTGSNSSSNFRNPTPFHSTSLAQSHSNGFSSFGSSSYDDSTAEVELVPLTTHPGRSHNNVAAIAANNQVTQPFIDTKFEQHQPQILSIHFPRTAHRRSLHYLPTEMPILVPPNGHYHGDVTDIDC